MPGFFEALGNLPDRTAKKFFVTVAGEKHQVNLEKKRWVQQQGEDNLMIKDGEIVLKPRPKPKTRYSVLIQAEKGYLFQDDDIHWPTEIVEGGKAWLTE